MRFCSSCGAQVIETAAFCSNCGNPLTPPAPAATSVPSPTENVPAPAANVSDYQNQNIKSDFVSDSSNAPFTQPAATTPPPVMIEPVFTQNQSAATPVVDNSPMTSPAAATVPSEAVVNIPEPQAQSVSSVYNSYVETPSASPAADTPSVTETVPEAPAQNANDIFSDNAFAAPAAPVNVASEPEVAPKAPAQDANNVYSNNAFAAQAAPVNVASEPEAVPATPAQDVNNVYGNNAYTAPVAPVTPPPAAFNAPFGQNQNVNNPVGNNYNSPVTPPAAVNVPLDVKICPRCQNQCNKNAIVCVKCGQDLSALANKPAKAKTNGGKGKTVSIIAIVLQVLGIVGSGISVISLLLTASYGYIDPTQSIISIVLSFISTVIVLAGFIKGKCNILPGIGYILSSIFTIALWIIFQNGITATSIISLVATFATAALYLGTDGMRKLWFVPVALTAIVGIVSTINTITYVIDIWNDYYNIEPIIVSLTTSIGGNIGSLIGSLVVCLNAKLNWSTPKETTNIQSQI